MNVSAMLKRIYHWLDRKDNDKLHIPISKQMEYLEKQSRPKDDYDRGHLQYKCQMYLMSAPVKILSVIGSVFTIIPYIIYLRIRYIFAVQETPTDAVFVQNGMNTGIIPESLKEKYKQIQVCSFTDPGCLGNQELKILLNTLIKHPFSPYMLMKVAMKLSLYCGIIKRYDPKAIISYCETSYASAISTMYCEGKSIEHINIQHGDFLKSIKFSGFRFSSFYVWDKYYSEMFQKLQNTTTPYYIEKCENLTGVLPEQDQDRQDFEYDITYYLGNERHKQIEILAEELHSLSNMGFKCKVRLHPRETSENEAEKLFSDIVIEKPREVSLRESLLKTKYVCSQYSTVLLQAYFCNKKIVIDDCTDTDSYEMLKEVEYILLNVEHKLLSQLINDGNK